MAQIKEKKNLFGQTSTVLPVREVLVTTADLVSYNQGMADIFAINGTFCAVFLHLTSNQQYSVLL